MLDEIIAYFVARPLEIFNTVLALIGFILIGYGTYKVKNVAEAAREAANKSLEEITIKVSIGDLYSMASSLRELQDLIRNGKYQVALLRCQLLRPDIHSLRMREGFTSQDKKEQIQEMITGIRRLQDTLERVIGDTTRRIDAPRTNRQLSDFANTLYEWGEEIKFSTGDKNDSE